MYSFFFSFTSIFFGEINYWLGDKMNDGLWFLFFLSFGVASRYVIYNKSSGLLY